MNMKLNNKNKIFLIAIAGVFFLALQWVGNVNQPSTQIEDKNDEDFLSINHLIYNLDQNIGNVANASYLGELSDDFSGYAVSGVGDVNNDGYDDFIIGAYNNAENGADTGQTYLILGRETDAWQMDQDLGTYANASFRGEYNIVWGDVSGWAVAGIGDFNDDDYDDFVIGAYYSYDQNSLAGQTYLILGRETDAWQMDQDLGSDSNASFIGERSAERSGYSVSGVGDTNADGYDDFIIGAPQNNQVASGTGKCHLILGGKTGTWDIHTNLTLHANASFLGEQSSSFAGYKVSGVNDVNNDGYDDFVIAAPFFDNGSETFAGKSYLIFGRDTNTWQTDINLATGANASFIGISSTHNIGKEITGVGDVNADSYDDFIISGAGIPSTGWYGESYLLLGRPTNYWKLNITIDLVSNASFRANTYFSYCGVAGVGDVNADNYNDFIIGNKDDDEGGEYSGQSYLILGRTTNAWHMSQDLGTTSNASFIGENTFDFLGQGVAGVGDVNADGCDDFIIGAYNNSDTATGAGQTYLVLGSAIDTKPDIVITSPDNTTYGTNEVTLTYNVINAETVTIYIDDVANSTNMPSGTLLQSLSESVVHNLTIHAVDADSDEAINTVIFTVDLTPPDVIITSPDDVTTYGPAGIPLTYTVTGAVSVIVYIDNTANSTNMNSGYLLQGLGNGQHNLTIYAIDAGSNVNITTVLFTVDLVGPSVIITSPDAVQIYGSADIPLTYTVTGAVSVIVYLDNIANTTNMNSGYLLQGLSNGQHNLTIYAVDALSNVNITIVLFTIDLTPPDVIITSPNDVTIYGPADIPLTYTVTGAVSVIVYLDNTANTTIMNSGYLLQGLSEGTHNLTIYAVDAVSNVNITTVLFTIDLSVPGITITSPDDVTIYGPTDIPLTYTVTGAVSVIVYIDNIANTTNMNSGYLLQGLSEGTHNLTIYAIDGDSDETTITVIFTVDLTPPDVIVTSPDDVTIYGPADIPLTYTVTGAVSVIVYLDNTANTTIMNSGYLLQGLSNGQHNLTIYAVDALSNVNITTILFTIDLSVPGITITSPDDVTIYGSTDIPLTYTVTGAVSVIVYIDNIANTTNMNSGYLLQGLSEGTHNLTIYAIDGDSDETTITVIFTVDLTPPSVIIGSPMIAIYGFNDIPLTYTVTGAVSVIIYLDGFANYTNMNSGIILQDLSEGAHNLTIYAVDAGLNENVTTILFFIDLTSPEITITSPTDKTYETGDVTLTYSVTGAENLTIYVDSVANTTNMPSGTVLQNLDKGSHNLTIVAVDLVGNSNHKTIIFEVDLDESSEDLTDETTDETSSDDGTTGGSFLIATISLVGVIIVFRRRKLK